MVFRIAPDALVIGSTTAGTDGNVSQFSLPGGINKLFKGIGVYYHYSFLHQNYLYLLKLDPGDSALAKAWLNTLKQML